MDASQLETTLIFRESDEMLALFPTLAKLFNWRPGSKRPRSLADRADELTNVLGQFLPRNVAVDFTMRIFGANPHFDLRAKEYELFRYKVEKACKDFLDKVAWLRDNLGELAAQTWVSAVREGQELFFPPYLQGCFAIAPRGRGDENDNRGSGR